LDELFLWSFARRPSAEHRQVVLDHVARHAMDKLVGYENMLRAMINTKEFAFNQYAALSMSKDRAHLRRIFHAFQHFQKCTRMYENPLETVENHRRM
jgi:hypothetical protein